MKIVTPVSGTAKKFQCDGSLNTNGDSDSLDQEGSESTAGHSVYNVQPLDFVVVEFYVPQTKRFKYFIAKVVLVNSDFYKVIFLQHHKSKFFWPDFMEERNILPTQVRRIVSALAQKGEDVSFNKIEIAGFNYK